MKSVFKYLLLMSMLIGLAACSSDDDEPEFVATTSYSLTLSGSQQVPFNSSAQTAPASVEVDENNSLVAASIDISNVTGFAAAHLHVGGIGSNGEVAFTLSDDGAGMAVLEPSEATEEQIAAINSGQWYVNLHTADFPDGEIRAQIVSSDTVIVSFALSGEQEVPAVATDANGQGYASYNTATTDLEVRVNTSGVEDAVAAHIHTGRIGQNGPVLVGLEQTDDVNVWVSSAGLQLDADTFAVLASGGHYVNVHTPANAGGEIRGQILTGDFALVTFGLSGAQEVPAVSTTASGDGYALVNTQNFDLELRVVTQGVEDAVAAHIHTGRIGENGPVLVGLEQSMDDANVWMSPDDLAIDADIFAVLASGGHYVNVHTPANQGGEIRGQILTSNFALATFALSSSQEVPAVISSATGSGYAIVDTNDFSVELKVVTSGVEDAVAAHIHTGRVGENGPVLVGLEQSMDDANVWMSPDDLAIDADIFAVLASGGHYVNVHTPANQGGEIRGQILTSNFALATFALSGEQEVPAVSTEAMGSGYALVNTNDFALELKVLTEGVMNATMAHIHTGRIGTNGPVLVALEQSMDDANVWMAPADTAITADIFAVLASGGHYVNVHTPANPGGEIRGQILTSNYVLVTFPLSGEQEVPLPGIQENQVVTTDASGDGYALVNTMDPALIPVELVVITRGVDDAVAAHIHTGPAGENGPVLAPLMQDSENAGIWMAADDLTITAEIFAVLAAGGHYVNVHTPEYPAGEIRGQIQ